MENYNIVVSLTPMMVKMENNYFSITLLIV